MTERMSNSEQHEGGFNMADAGSLVNEAQGWGLPGEVSGRLNLEDWILSPSLVLPSSFACGHAQLNSRASPQGISPQFYLRERHLLSVYRVCFLFL